MIIITYIFFTVAYCATPFPDFFSGIFRIFFIKSIIYSEFHKYLDIYSIIVCLPQYIIVESKMYIQSVRLVLKQ